MDAVNSFLLSQKEADPAFSLGAKEEILHRFQGIKLFFCKYLTIIRHKSMIGSILFRKDRHTDEICELLYFIMLAGHFMGVRYWRAQILSVSSTDGLVFSPFILDRKNCFCLLYGMYPKAESACFRLFFFIIHFGG